jgi:hypothetical protein
MSLPLVLARNPVVDPAWPTNPTINLIFTAGSGLAVLAGLVMAVRYYRREGTVAGFTCLIGGAVASLFEPLTAANGFVYYPRQEQITLFAAYDVKIPLFLTLSYTAEIGLGALAVWRLLKGGGGPAAILKVWLIVALGDVVLETPALWLHVFYYYGPQPLDLWGMPLYWAVLDGALGILPGVVVYLCRDWGADWARKAWHQLVIVALFPSSVAFFYVGAGWPIWTLMHTDLPETWIWAGSLVTVALTYLFVRTLAALSTLPPEVVDRLRATSWAGSAPVREQPAPTS